MEVSIIILMATISLPFFIILALLNSRKIGAIIATILIAVSIIVVYWTPYTETVEHSVVCDNDWETWDSGGRKVHTISGDVIYTPIYFDELAEGNYEVVVVKRNYTLISDILNGIVDKVPFILPFSFRGQELEVVYTQLHKGVVNYHSKPESEE